MGGQKLFSKKWQGGINGAKEGLEWSTGIREESEKRKIDSRDENRTKRGRSGDQVVEWRTEEELLKKEVEWNNYP